MALPVTDTFTGADGTALTAYSAAWSNITGVFEINTNAVRSNSSGADTAARRNDETFPNNQYSQITLVAVAAGIFIGPMVRGASGANTWYGHQCDDSGTQYLIRYLAGVYAELATESRTQSVSDVMRLEVMGTSITAKINGSERFGGPVTNSDIASGYAGICGYSSLGGTRGDSFEAGSLAQTEQEGARFRNDDGSETTATWAAAQDANITAPLSANLRFRALVNASVGDPASTAYKLKYQKNGAGGYQTIPIVATADPVTPVIEAGDCTVSGNNTAQATWAVSHPNASTGDLLIFYIAWDDSTATTDVSEPSGPNGETLTEINATPITDSSTETRAKAWYCKATGSWTAGTITFTPAATESWSATCIRVPAGEFDATTPIGAAATRTTTGTADTAALSPAFTAGASDGYGKLVWCAGVDTDPLTGTVTNWTILQQQDLGAVAHGVVVRNAAVTNNESIAGGNTWTIAGDSWTSIAFIVRAPAGIANGLYVAASANITAGGEATTAQLTAPSGKTTGDFVTGRMWDNENGSDSIDITSLDYTELEWCLLAQSPTVNTDYFDLRVYAGDVALDTYTVTPRWTIGTAGYTLNLAAGAYSLSGAAATLLKTKLLNLAAGSYVYTGAAATLSKGVVVSLASGNYALTGQAATLLATHTLNLAAGAYALTGAALTTLWARTVGLDAGVYGLTGQAAALLYARSLALTAGAYTLSGQPLTAIWARIMALDAGAYTQSGASATLLRGYVLTLTAGGYVLSGADAELTITGVGAYTLNLNPGSYAVTGGDIATLYNRVISADMGAYTVSGAGLGMTAAGVESDFSSGPYPLIIPRRLVETPSNEERARLLTALLVVLE